MFWSDTTAELIGSHNYLYNTSTGFGVQNISGTNNPNINVSGGNYVFLAIA
jgi:hypothetical protein